MESSAYCDNLFAYKRIKTNKVTIDSTSIGGDAPILIQSMTTTNTNEAKASAEQTIRIVNAGGQMVRLTTQGTREAENLRNIRGILDAEGCHVPLVADVHFNPAAALTAAGIVEKVRINPGNFTGEAKRFNMDADKMSDEEWKNIIVSKLTPLVEVCKANNTTLRIGVNHGSLSDRIMAKYGDTPQGMVASCIEYIEALESLDFHRIVISIKSSNTRVMVETVRLLMATMRQRDNIYPMHLGVTEAGSDSEGRIKSAAGIGALLVDGIGDTIRVSLTEAPEAEIPVARMLADYIKSKEGHSAIKATEAKNYSPYEYKKRETYPALNLGGNNKADIIKDENIVKEFATLENIDQRTGETYVRLSLSELNEASLNKLRSRDNIVVVAKAETTNPTAEIRALVLELENQGIKAPVVAWLDYDTRDVEELQLQAAADAGLLFIDGLADGLLLTDKNIAEETRTEIAYGILQATQVRFSKAEFISCPGCGRTLYDIQAQTKKIKERFAHLKGLKIAIMGCIVNGIGEMADADYGYVGAGRGKISLYRNKTLIKSNLPEENAMDELVNLIKSDNLWND